jgi:hypothetical protein
MVGLIARWLPPGGKVLDVGCGNGRMPTASPKRGISGLGIDPYADDVGRRRRLTAEEMDQLSKSFDLVYRRYTLHHLDAPRKEREGPKEEAKAFKTAPPRNIPRRAQRARGAQGAGSVFPGPAEWQAGFVTTASLPADSSSRAKEYRQ